MLTVISSAAYAARKALLVQGLDVKHNHLNEVIAGLMGYRTYSALKIEEADTRLDAHLVDADLLVLNHPMAVNRCIDLGLPAEVVEPLLTACISALRAAAGIPVFVGIDDFYFSHAQERMEQEIDTFDSVGDATASSNATFEDAAELDQTPEISGDLWVTQGDWWIQASGTLTGSYDPDGDRMYSSVNAFQVGCRLNYEKAGRAGLIFRDSDEGDFDTTEIDEFEGYDF